MAVFKKESLSKSKIVISEIYSDVYTGIKIASVPICVEQHNKKTCIICTGVVWLVSPVAIVFSMLHTNEVICKLTA